MSDSSRQPWKGLVSIRPMLSAKFLSASEMTPFSVSLLGIRCPYLEQSQECHTREEPLGKAAPPSFCWECPESLRLQRSVPFSMTVESGMAR